ncbi:MAG: hypothetical protein ACLQOZ_01550 [Acidimicrobiales bacterium]|jgi:hypothetical protein
MAKARRGRKRPGSSTGLPDGGARREHWRADGMPKTRFARADDANRASLRLRLEEGADLDPYPCEYCGGWHLGNRRR